MSKKIEVKGWVVVNPKGRIVNSFIGQRPSKDVIAWAWAKDDKSRYSSLSISMPKDYIEAKNHGYRIKPARVIIEL